VRGTPENEPLYWEDLAVGDQFLTRSRIIAKQDLLDFAALSGDLNPIHVDEAEAHRIGLAGIVPQTNLVIAIASGLIYELGIFTGTGVALNRLTWQVQSSLQLGDSISCRVTISNKVAIDDEHGLIRRQVEVLKEDDEVVHVGTHEIVMRRRR
jgi:acyl dehydratase